MINNPDAIEFTEWLIKRLNRFAYLFAYAIHNHKTQDASEFLLMWNNFYNTLNTTIHRFNIEIEFHEKENGPIRWLEIEIA